VKVHILATCRKPALIGGTLLVFGSLRVGFPTSEIVVYDNANAPDAKAAIAAECERNGCKVVEFHTKVNHGDWVDSLVSNETDPFWICDTDVIFWKTVEQWMLSPGACLSGIPMPEFFDSYSKSWSQPRIHTCLMHIRPAEIRSSLKLKHFPEDDPFKIQAAPMVKPFWFLDHNGRRVFYDTASMLSAHVPCRELSDEQMDCFDHLNGGTYYDLLREHYDPSGSWHERVFQNPEIAKGSWRKMRKMFQSLGKLNLIPK
jgi:hypothetical protein